MLHYLLFGGAEGRDPNELFDSDRYLQQNSDVRAAGINPLLHYLRHGAAEGRDPHPLFDTARYLANHPDVSAAGINPLSHYLQHGAHEMRAPNSRTLQNDGAVAASAVGFAPVPPESFGYFERVEDGCISGWSCDAIGSAAPVIVLVNGVVAATVMAGHQNRFEIRLRLVPGDRVEVLNATTGRALSGGVRRAVDPRWRPRIAIVAPAKQEAAYLLEWIAYHRALGVEIFPDWRQWRYRFDQRATPIP